MKIGTVITLLLAVWHWPVSAATSCTSANLRFASSSNTLYVQAGGICRIADIAALKPLQLVSQGDGIYLLKANLKLTDGSALLIDGDDPTDPVIEFRLLSNNTGLANSVVNLTADYGIVQINHTKVLSWDEAVEGPDTDYTTANRAYIRVRSGAADKQSRMDVTGSDIGYLGYYASESYGLTWKVSGTLNDVRVYGNILNSRIHNNYFGVFTYGAYGMMISGNEFDHNVKYGLDPHDDSDYLTITSNTSHHNGDHGIICSQRCNNLVIRYNTSYSNAGHGIMLHRSVDYSLVENNQVFDNEDTGIALFESNNNIIRGNIVQGNKTGIRLSVGSSYNSFQGNMIFGNTDNAIYTYQGSDEPARVGNDGINRENVWSQNDITATGAYILKLSATDGDTFSDNDFTGNPLAKFYLKGAVNTTYSNNLLDPEMTLP
ncbi:right-handed parallel beta-helix repeat-containing protein [uncultured Tolumonas sp.]|uniref:right-handed parallel beta-helix repeat-containing protein n=1 Tax=uncultured Tolumonas sp. TaxID=263765 RepID=UPI002A0A3C74|nr:right-handed parallel beta-helix repeat-containing protein [uncultured Tolumonas sp.]